MSAHTPGPWAVEVDKTGDVTVYEAVTLQNIDICKMGGNANDGSNARLIAAAPELLAACVAYLNDRREAGCTADMASVKAMRAAVANATGEEA